MKIFNIDNSNIAFIKTQNHQIMATNAQRILNLEFKIKNRANHFETTTTYSVNQHSNI